MRSEYNWHPGMPSKSVFKVETRNLGWWVLLAIIISVIVHILLYFTLGMIHRQIGGFDGAEPVGPAKHKQVSIDRSALEELLADPTIPDAPPAKPEKLSDMNLTDKSLDEFDLMEKAKVDAIRMSPIEAPQIFGGDAPQQAATPAMSSAADQMEIASSEMLSKDLADIRNKLVESSANISVAQPTLELGSTKDPAGEVDTDSFFKEAAAKAFGKDASEFIKGYSSLDDMIGRTGGVPVGEEKIAIPTDILFGYNESDLKEQAQLSMMKLAFLVQTNPDATFIIEGHTDSFGGDDFNRQLSIKRADAVRRWLVDRLRISDETIKVVGYGKTRPIVSTEGDADAQALNRRVEIVVKRDEPAKKAE